MKKIIFFLLFLFALSISAQQLDHLKAGHYCTHASGFHHLIDRSAPYVQNNLLQSYDVTFYFLDLNVDATTTNLSGSVFIEAVSVVTELDTFVLELIDEIIVDSVLFNNTITTFTHQNNDLLIDVLSPPTTGENFSCKVYYHGQPPSGGFFTGVTSAIDENWGVHVTWTLSQPFNARQWFPVKQVLEDKADSVWVFLTIDTTYKAGSQGLLTSIVEVGETKRRYEWKSRYPIAYYLISFSVADYQEYNIYANPAALPDDSILIQNYVYDAPNCLQNYKAGIDNTKEFLELFSDLYTLYPFYKEKYGHCMAYLSGGMEHQTMTTIGYFGYGIVAHELGHMWWGDHVTCATWSDVWINEGFATYSDYLAHEFLAGGDYPQIWLEQVHTSVLSEPGGSVYIPPGEIDPDDPSSVFRIFDNRLSYLKGASIVHMLRFELQNDALFWDILQHFQLQYADSVATGLDFLETFNELSGMDFNYFFNQWYFGEGYPVYDIHWNQLDDIFTMTTVQSTSTTTTSFFKMLMEYRLVFDDDTDTTLKLWQTEQENNYSIPITKPIVSIEVDPKNWNLEKVNSIIYGIDSNETRDFEIYPNPVRNNLTIVIKNMAVKHCVLKLYDDSGRIIHNSKLDHHLNTIDLSSCSAGIIMVNLQFDNRGYFRKVVKL